MGVREFKFFHGITIHTEGIRRIIRTLRAQWEPDLIEDAVAELTRLLSEEIERGVDENVIGRITRRINGGQRA